MTGPRKPARWDRWENDDAHQGLQQWITAWRKTVDPSTPRPSWRFAEHLGREAVTTSGQGVTRVDLLRLFAAAGYDGLCLCGRTPDEVVAGAASATGGQRTA